MDIIQTAIDSANVLSGDELDELRRESACFRLLIPFIGETVNVQFDHDDETYTGTLRFDGPTEDWTVGPVDEVAFRTHWLNAIDIDLDGALLLALVIPPDELEELIEMGEFNDE